MYFRLQFELLSTSAGQWEKILFHIYRLSLRWVLMTGMSENVKSVQPEWDCLHFFYCKRFNPLHVECCSNELRNAFFEIKPGLTEATFLHSTEYRTDEISSVGVYSRKTCQPMKPELRFHLSNENWSYASRTTLTNFTMSSKVENVAFAAILLNVFFCLLADTWQSLPWRRWYASNCTVIRWLDMESLLTSILCMALVNCHKGLPGNACYL